MTGKGEMTRVILYARVSTEEQRLSGLGLQAQRDAIRAASASRGWVVAAELEDAASGGSLDRPALRYALEMLDRHEADAFMVSRLDRATRSVADFAQLLDRLGRSDAAFVALDLGVDTSTPGGRLVATVIASVAEWERAVIAERTRNAMRALPREKRNGRPCFTEATRKQAQALRAEGLTLREIAEALTKSGVVPVRGGTHLHPTTIARLLID